MLSANDLTLSISAAAIALSKGLSNDETALLGAVFTQLGDTLTMMSLAAPFLSKTADSNAQSVSK
jgi:hypothetical protein